MQRFPVLQSLGPLTPDASLVEMVSKPHFELGGFTNGAEQPPALVAFLEKHGYQPAESRGMLFASNHGVELHADEMPAALWVLDTGEGQFCGHSRQLIVGNTSRKLVPSEVLLFDSRKPHAVVSTEPGRWIVFSTYVKRIRAKPGSKATTEP